VTTSKAILHVSCNCNVINGIYSQWLRRQLLCRWKCWKILGKWSLYILSDRHVCMWNPSLAASVSLPLCNQVGLLLVAGGLFWCPYYLEHLKIAACVFVELGNVDWILRSVLACCFDGILAAVCRQLAKSFLCRAGTNAIFLVAQNCNNLISLTSS